MTSFLIVTVLLFSIYLLSYKTNQLFLRLVFLFLLPVGQTPDEIFILRRIWSEVLNSVNPLLNTDNFKLYPNNEYYYPPLYFLIGKYLIRIIYFFKNIPFSYDQAFSQIYLGLRFLSFSLSIVTLILAWKILEKLKINYHIQLAVFIFVSLLPSLVSFSISANHNNLLFFLMLLFIYLSIATKWQPPDFKKAAIFGLIFGLILITKLDGVILLPAFLSFVLLLKKKRSIFYFFSIFFLLAFLAGGWWYFLNLYKIGWFYSRDLFEASIQDFSKPIFGSNYLLNVFLGAFTTFFVVYGIHNNIFIGGLLYVGLMVMSLMSIAGLLLLLRTKYKEFFKNPNNKNFKRVYFLLSLIFLMNILIFLYVNLLHVFQAQGRYFFPSIIFIGLNFVLGLSYWFGKKNLFTLPILLLMVFLIINLWGIGCVAESFYDVNILPGFVECLKTK